MKAKKLDLVEPVLGAERERRGPTALSEIQLTPRSELGAAKIHTKARRSVRKKPNLKSLDDAQNHIFELESQIANLNDQIRAAHDENREMGLKYKKLLRQMESIYVKAADAVENVE